MKVLWITNMPTIYRVYFFNELGRYCDLTVIFERYSATGIDNKWADDLAENFKFKFLKTRPIGREGSFSIDILRIRLSEYDKIIISSYSSPTEMLLLLKLKFLRKDYFLEVDGGIIKKENIIMKGIKTFFISGANAYFSTSDNTSKYLCYYGAKKELIFKYNFTSLFQKDILNQPIDKEEKNLIKAELGIKNKYVILSVGQFIYRKGFDILLNAYKELNNDILVYLIGGIETEEYKSIIKKYNMQNIRFLPNIPKHELEKYYLIADLFVLPTREDIWGLVINEAMAKGLPIITTDNCVAGLELIENGKNGFIVSVNDQDDLLEKTKYILDNKLIRENMKKESLNKIKNYSLEKMAYQHFCYFKEL